MNKNKVEISIKTILKAISVFVVAYLIIDSSWMSIFQDFSKGQCIGHQDDKNAEYLILDKIENKYLLGIINLKEIKVVNSDSEFTKKSYINKFYKKVDCPKNIKEIPVKNDSIYIESLRNERMIQDLNTYFQKSK